jgi:hypothetical protein
MRYKPKDKNVVKLKKYLTKGLKPNFKDLLKTT